MLKIQIRHIFNLQIKGLAQLPAKHILQIHPDEIPTLKEKIEIQKRREIGSNLKANTELDRNQQELTSAVINIGYPFAVADGNRYHGSAKTNQLIDQKTTADFAIEMARRKSHLRANKRNPELEMLARTNKLLINLDSVERCIHAENQINNKNIENINTETNANNNFENTRKVVVNKINETNQNFEIKTDKTTFEINIKACRNQVGQTQALAEHYGLYRDIFGPAFSNNSKSNSNSLNENCPSSQYIFHPHVPMQILYSHSQSEKSGDLEQIELGKEGEIATEKVDNENTNQITNEIESLADLNSSNKKSADSLNSNKIKNNEKYVFSPVYRGNILDAFETSQSPEITILTPYATCSLINNSEKNIKTRRSPDLGYYTLLLTSLDPGLPITVEKPSQKTENISVLPSPFYDHTPDQLIKGGAFDSLDRRNVKHIERYDTVKRYTDSLDNPNTSIQLQLNVPPRFLNNDNKINIIKTLNSADRQSGDFNSRNAQNHMTATKNTACDLNLPADFNGIKTQNHMAETGNTADISNLSAVINGKTQNHMAETGKTAVRKSADQLEKLYQADMNKFDLTDQGIIDDPRNEVLHWFVANIPAHADKPSRVKFFPQKSADLNHPYEFMNECKTGDGEGQQLLPYIRPFFPRGLGYHRMVFLLFHHKTAVPTSDYASYLMGLSKENASQKSAYTLLNNQLISSRVFSSRHFYRTFQSELTAVEISWFQATWHDILHSFYQKELKIPAPSVEYQQLDPFRSDQMSFPAKQKFNTYLDYYEDPKARAKRVTLAQLTHVNASPFVQSWSRAQRSSESFLLNVDTSTKNIKTKWMRDDITKQRLGQPPYDRIYQLDD